MHRPAQNSLVKALRASLGEKSVVTDADLLASYGSDRAHLPPSSPLCVLLPKTVSDVKTAIRICADAKTPIVPSGGRTGYCGGAYAKTGQVVLSLEKLNRLIEIDPIAKTLHCEAGMTTEKIQNAAASAGLYYPVDLAPRGSCQIGGNIATNAGGIRVIKYGTTRNYVLGLKVILADGSELDMTRKLYKDEAGYSLKDLFIGSEGTLGVIVEAVVKLTTMPKARTAALCGMESLGSVLSLYNSLTRSCPHISAFEYISGKAMEFVLRHSDLSNPFPETYHHYCLVEIEREFDESAELLKDHIGNSVSDCIISNSAAHFKSVWTYRELISEKLSLHTLPHKSDISLPVSAIEEFISELLPEIEKAAPRCPVIIFGHIGDGNLHINIVKPKDMPEDCFNELCGRADSIMYGLVAKYKGSVSAEHGIGILKRDLVKFCRESAELSIMKKIKESLDPHNILNRGKIFKYEGKDS